MPNLERLTVAGSLAFNDDGMAAVAQLTGLKEFRTWHAGGTNEGVKKLSELKNLKSLYLGQRLTYKLPACPNDETIAILSKFKSLESLQLDEARLTFGALAAAQAIARAEEIDARRYRHCQRRCRAAEARTAPGEGRMDRTQRGLPEAYPGSIRR